MLAIGRTTILLLAAGRSTRFGQGDKLLFCLAGKPLVAHPAELAAALPFRSRLAVVPALEGPLANLLGDHGFELVRNPDPAAGRETSLRLGLRAALETGCEAILVLLGDMPWVTAAHVERLHDVADEGQAAVSASGGVRMPPVLIPARLPSIALARGQSIKHALGKAAEVPAGEACLKDFDTAADFEAAAAAPQS